MEPVSTIVIKVKYGDMMRRFNARIIGGGLDLSLDELKRKIFSSFSITPDGELILTYIDEDGDVVHLVDNDDLRDVVKQSLNPVRITARLNSQLNAGDRSSTSVRSPQGQQPLEDLQAGVTKVIEALPEPFRETLANLSPHVFEIVDAFSKVGLSYNDQSSDSQPRAQPSKNNEPENSSLSKDMAAVKINTVEPKVLSTSRKEQPVNKSESSKNAQLVGVKESDGKELENASRKEEDKVLRSSSLKCEHTAPRRVCKKPKVKKVKDLLGDLKTTTQIPVKIADLKKHSSSSPVPRCSLGITDADRLSYLASCPPVIHSGVHCDGCGIYPITGPRFKSKVKFNYDLCLICYAKMGNSIDYIKMDFPEAVHQNHDTLNRLYNAAQMKEHPARTSMLNSCFIEDVNVFDGSAMAPLTPFTKIWRMRNNGIAEWPHGTQLVCIGGDLLRTSLSVELEVPKFGVPVGQMLDIAVEFIAPERPGQYISYWRMLSPSGKQFGQRVWVLIEVDTSLSPVNNSDVNLNIPALSCSPLSSMGINLDPVRIDGSTPQPQVENKETVEPVVGMQSSAENYETVEPVVEVQLQAENNKKTVEVVEPVVEMQPHTENNKKIVEIVEPIVEMQMENNKKIVEIVEPVEIQSQTENKKKIVEIVEPVVEKQSQSENIKNTVELVEPFVEMQSRNLNEKTVEIVEPVVDMEHQTKNNEITVELVEPAEETLPHKSQEMNFPVNDNLLVGNDASSSLVTPPSDPFLLLLNSSEPVTASDSGALNSGPSVPDPTGIVINPPYPSASVSSAQESHPVLPGKMEVEEKLLKELEEMGFTEVHLNKEVLRMNEYDLEQAVDDLCDVSEWDPMLEELEEMGFCDTAMNKQLLEKNNGSIVRVVMDLIAGEDNN